MPEGPALTEVVRRIERISGCRGLASRHGLGEFARAAFDALAERRDLVAPQSLEAERSFATEVAVRIAR